MTKTTLYSRNARGVVSVWSIWRRGIFVYRQWGQKDGKQQITMDTCSAVKGKNAFEVAKETEARYIKRKIEDGFTSELLDVRAKHTVQKRDFDFKKLPVSFAPQKPVQEMPPSVNPEADHYISQRKRDGQRHYTLVTHNGCVRLYSRKMHDMTDHFPQIVRALNELELPCSSVLDGEIICDRDGRDDFRGTNEVCRSKAERGAKVESKLPIRYMVFDYLYRDGKELWKRPYHVRHMALEEDIKDMDSDRILLPESFHSFEEATIAAREGGWEGLVVWDLDAPNVLRMDGKHKRHGSYKWKPRRTHDFVAIGWLPGKGRLKKLMGKLRIAEWQGKKLVEIGKLGTGFDDATRKDAMGWKFPCVVEVEYDKQHDDTRALREPVFLRRHPDKTVAELRHG